MSYGGRTFAKIVRADGYTFDSEMEYIRYQELVQLQEQGHIQSLQVHPVYRLQEEFTKNGTVYPAITYEADYAYYKDGQLVIEDVKGECTETFLVKQKLFEYLYPEYHLTVLGYTKQTGFIPLEELLQRRKENKKAKAQAVRESNRMHKALLTKLRKHQEILQSGTDRQKANVYKLYPSEEACVACLEACQNILQSTPEQYAATHKTPRRASLIERDYYIWADATLHTILKQQHISWENII